MALLTDDVFMSMPPMPLECRGRDSVARFFAITLAGDRIGAMIRFEDTVLSIFGLPPSLPGAQ